MTPEHSSKPLEGEACLLKMRGGGRETPFPKRGGPRARNTGRGLGPGKRLGVKLIRLFSPGGVGARLGVPGKRLGVRGGAEWGVGLNGG